MKSESQTGIVRLYEYKKQCLGKEQVKVDENVTIRNRHRRFNILLSTPNGDGGGALIKERTLESKRSGPEVIKLFSCSTQLSMTFSCL